MEPITMALVAGATFLLQGVASEAMKDAYKGLKDLLASKLTSLANLEDDPADEDYREAAEKELQKKGLAQDPGVLAKAELLTQALAQEPPEQLAKASIDISHLRAAHGIIVKQLHAAGDLRVKNVESQGGAIDIQGLSAGGSAKN
jgi:hypothetical protein